MTRSSAEVVMITKRQVSVSSLLVLLGIQKGKKRKLTSVE